MTSEMHSPSQPMLYVVSGPAKGRKVLLGREAVTLGRRDGMAVSIKDPKLSGHHADVMCSDGAYVLRDCMSTNGTFVNGELVTEARLADNDRIRMGHSELIFTSLERLDEVEAMLTAGGSVELKEDSDTSALRTPKVQVSLATQSVRVGVVGDDERLATAHKKLWSLYEIGRRINVLSELDAVLALVVSTILNEMDADRAVLLLADEATGELRPALTKCRDAAGPDQPVQLSETIVRQAVESRQSILTEDAGSDERFAGGESIALMGIRSAMCVPLLANEKVVGAAYVDKLSRMAAFATEDLEFLTVLCNSASISIENARLFSEVQATNRKVIEAHAKLEASYRELEETQQKLIQAEKLSSLGRLVAGIAHDLKNILTSVTGYAQLLKMPTSSEKQDMYIQRLNEATTMCTRMVRDLLGFAREDEVKPAPTDVSAFVNEAIEVVRTPAEEAGVEIVCEFAEALPRVKLDALQMTRVVTNLMTNAIHAMEETDGPRRLTVGTAREGDSVRLSVADSGPGIPEEIVVKIFDPFFTTKSKGKGTGLGLSLCQGLVTAHGGDISVASSPGQGACFTIRLPIEGPSRGSGAPSKGAEGTP